MKKLLAIAVLMLSIIAGFTARAEAAGKWDYQVYFNKPGQFTYCGTKANKSSLDVLVGNREFKSSDKCLLSYEFTHFKEQLNGKPFKKTKVVPKKNPLLENLGDGVISIEQEPTADKYVKAYTRYFEAQTKVSIDRNKIFFAKLKGKPVGFCYVDKQLVVIDKEYWLKATPNQRQILLFHEFGHCYFKREHNHDKLKKFDGDDKECPTSLMLPHIFNYQDAHRCWAKNKTYYFKELKKPAVKKFKLNINLYKWEDKNWKKLPSLTNVTHRQKFKIGDYKCSVYRNGSKPRKYGYVAEFIRIRCTQDLVSYISLAASCNYQTTKDAWKQGWATRSKQSSNLQLEDTILKELYAIIFNCSL